MRLLLKLAAVIAVGFVIQLAFINPEKKLKEAEYEGRVINPQRTAYMNLRVNERVAEFEAAHNSHDIDRWIALHNEINAEFDAKRKNGTLPPLPEPWELPLPDFMKDKTPEGETVAAK